MSEPRVLLNGRVLPASEAVVSIRDRAFRYGEGLFETMRARRDRTFRLGAHLARLRASASALGWDLPWTDAELGGAVARVLEANPRAESRVRLQVSPGPGERERSLGPPTLLVEAEPFHPVPEERRRRGVSLAVARVVRRRGSAGVKSSSYLDSLLARRGAVRAGHDDAVVLNDAGEVCEASMANLFAVRDGVLWTPPVESGAVPGITRAAVLQLATGWPGLRTRESALSLAQLLSAEEAFLTSTGVEVLPAARIDGRPVGAGEPGPVARWLLEAYRRLLDHELGPQG